MPKLHEIRQKHAEMYQGQLIFRLDSTCVCSKTLTVIAYYVRSPYQQKMKGCDNNGKAKSIIPGAD